MICAAACTCAKSWYRKNASDERLVREQAVGGIDRQPADLLRRLGRDLLDVDAARGTHHEHRALRLAVHDQADVGLAGDVGGRHHEHLAAP